MASVEKIQQAGHGAQVAFGAACVERVAAIYELVREDRVPHLAVELAWRLLRTPNAAREEVAAAFTAIDRGEGVLSHEQVARENQAPLQICSAARFLLQAASVLSNDVSEEIEFAAFNALEAVNCYVNESTLHPRGTADRQARDRRYAAVKAHLEAERAWQERVLDLATASPEDRLSRTTFGPLLEEPKPWL